MHFCVPYLFSVILIGKILYRTVFILIFEQILIFCIILFAECILKTNLV